MTIDEKILLYTELPEKERLDVERYVAEHPEWTAALDEAKALDMLLREARVSSDEMAADEALAYYVVSKRLPGAPADSRAPLADIEEWVSRDPNLQNRLDDLEKRRENLERLHPAGEQFDRLVLRAAANRMAATAPEPHEEISDRKRVPDPAHIRYMWRAAAVIVALAVMYSILFKVGRMNESETDRLARFDREELTVEGFESLRQEDLASDTSTSGVLYLLALDQLSEAQQSFFGLFPRFHASRVDSASRLLQRVLALEPEDSFLAAEASYLLGKAHLAAGDVEAARQALQRVVESRSRRGEMAAAILAKLDDGSAASE